MFAIAVMFGANKFCTLYTSDRHAKQSVAEYTSEHFEKVSVFGLCVDRRFVSFPGFVISAWSSALSSGLYPEWDAPVIDKDRIDMPDQIF